MTSRGNLRGHPIFWDEHTEVWRYTDNGEPTAETWLDRPCGYCGEYAGAGSPDPCLGYLPGVSNACCGHGKPEEAYIQFENGFTVRGIMSLEPAKTPDSTD